MPLEKSYHPKGIEKKHSEKWELEKSFACGLSNGVPQNKFLTPYTIVIPPPNVTGNLHMGHALNNTLQDILIRFYRMAGHDVLWQPGTDHAGIATQMIVERQLNQKGIELDRGQKEPKGKERLISREKFIKKVWEWKEKSGNTITKQLRRLGASCDWSRERFTMDEGLSKAVRHVFVKLYEEGLIYKDKRLVNWDTKLHTAISDLEVEQREVEGSLWYFKYPLEGFKNRFITVATTRPETMLGDTGVAVNPDDSRYKGVVGKFVTLPIANRSIPILGDSYSDPTKGSGAVKITPAHDFNDFEVGKRHDLEMINIFDVSGYLNSNVPKEFRGLDRFVAREKVVQIMKELGLLEKIENNPMTVPYGDRSGEVIEPRLTDQWYVDTRTLAKPAIKAVKEGKTKFVPENWSNTYFEWMNNIEPWCISRQIWWGHQIPAWYGADGQIFVAENVEEAEKKANKFYGGNPLLVQDSDVLDTWFSSALWPFSTLGWPEETEAIKRYYPTDVLVTGFDIIFFWVARMMMMGLHFKNEVPFHTVYIHALVRDEHGQKMSKSKGNVLDPLDLIDEYGADALRFTLAAMAAQGRDVKLSSGRIQGYRNFITKLWNAARYAEMNGCFSDPTFTPSKCSLKVNKWIIRELALTEFELSKALSDYRFNDAANVIYHFTWHTFCDWYIEFTKTILIKNKKSEVAEIRLTTGWVLDQILLLLHPFTPFVTEELWEKMSPSKGRTTSLITTPWPNDLDKNSNQDAQDEMGWLVKLITQIRAVRSEMNVPAGAIVPLLLKGGQSSTWKLLNSYSDIIKQLSRVKSISENNDVVGDDTIQIVVDEEIFLLELANVINVHDERDRLNREMEKLEIEIREYELKLSNKKFLERAPAAVVENNRERLIEAHNVKGKVEEAIKRLEAF